jgi:hypothetical protein
MSADEDRICHRAWLASRESLSSERLAREFFASYPFASVVSCLEFLEDELDIPVGLLRPEDDALSVLSPDRRKGSLSNWLERQMSVANAETYLLSELVRRAEDSGRPRDRFDLSSLGKIVEAWCATT